MMEGGGREKERVREEGWRKRRESNSIPEVQCSLYTVGKEERRLK